MVFLGPLSLLAMVGCASKGTAPGSSAPLFLHEVPVGMHLSLERSVKFEPGSLRIYLQNGEVHHGFGFFGRGGVDRYRTYCTLVLGDSLKETDTLTPREFTIESFQQDTTYLLNELSEFRTEWRLSSENSPKPWAFTCYKVGNAAYEGPIKMREIDVVVGDYLRIKPATPAKSAD